MTDDTKIFICFIMFLIAIFTCGYMYGKYSEKTVELEKRIEFLDEAVKAKVAEYYLDENNKKQFRYKESK